jgi:inositol-1,4,5-trisphosphate 5-phosphatase
VFSLTKRIELWFLFFPPLQFPNSYSLNRRKALDHTVQKFFHDGLDNVPVFFFGDFNFRLDTGNVVKVSTGSNVNSNSEDAGACQYFGENNELVFTLGKKEFSRLDHDDFFLKDNGLWVS